MLRKEIVRTFKLSKNIEVKYYWHGGIELWVACIARDLHGPLYTFFFGVDEVSPLVAFKRARRKLHFNDDPKSRKVYSIMSGIPEDKDPDLDKIYTKVNLGTPPLIDWNK